MISPVNNSQHIQIRYGLIGATLAGLLQILSLPNALVTTYTAWHSGLALISFIPFIWVWRRSSWASAFGYSWIMGFIYFVGILTWIRLIGRNTNIDNAFAWLFFAICGGIYFGLFGTTARMIKDKLYLPDALVLPIAWVTWEYLRGHILTGGWPWGSLGHTQYANPLIRQMASVAGVGGISFLVIVINVFLADLLKKFFHKSRTPSLSFHYFFLKIKSFPASFRKNPIQTSLISAIILLWIVLIFICIIETIQFTHTAKDQVQLALLQGNINTRQKWDRNYRIAAMKKMTRLHLKAAEKKPDLIVWAESCFPGILEHPSYKEWEDQLRALIKQGNTRTVLTSNEYQREKNLEAMPTWHHYNSAFYIGKEGQILGRYRKIYLVPFGEYIPYNFLKRYLQTVVQEPIPIDFEAGDDYTVFSLGKTAFSVLICYEDIFEELGYQLAKAGADFFLCVANNSWSGNSAMSYQHTAMSVFLAVEHRAYVAKADMTGPTCVIDPWGNIGKPLPYFVDAVKFETIYSTHFRTFFTRRGNIIPFFFSLLFFTLLGVSLYPAGKTTTGLS